MAEKSEPGCSHKAVGMFNGVISRGTLSEVTIGHTPERLSDGVAGKIGLTGGSEGLGRSDIGGIGLRGEGGRGLIISVKGGMVTNGSVLCGAESFGTGVGIIAGAAGTPKPRRSEGEGVAAGGDIAHVEALRRSDVSVSSVECLQRSFQLGGSEPFRIASRVVKLSSNTRWN